MRVIKPIEGRQPLLKRLEITSAACPVPPAVLKGSGELLKKEFGDAKLRPVDGTWTLNTQYSNPVVRYNVQHCRRCLHFAVHGLPSTRVRSNNFAVVVSMDGHVSYLCYSNGGTYTPFCACSPILQEKEG